MAVMGNEHHAVSSGGFWVGGRDHFDLLILILGALCNWGNFLVVVFSWL